MPFQTLQVEQSADGLLRVTLNRENVRNALNTQMGIELREVFSPLAFHPQSVRCVLITGAGDKAFCAGGDLKERNGMTDDQWRIQHAIFEEAYYAVMNCTAPVIAAVNGSAFGGGCELALACDFIYAANTARFALPETSLGIIPGCGGTQNLPRAVGQRRAKELILTGKAFTAEEAHEWGMVNLVCEPDQLLTLSLAAAQNICTSAPVAVRQAKTAIRRGLDVDLRTGLAIEIEAYNRHILTSP